VLPAVGAAANVPVPATPAVAQAAAKANDAASFPLASGPNQLWLWLSVAFASAWLLTVLAWWWSRRREQKTATPVHPQRPDEKQVLARLQKACAANDAETSKAVLLEWAALRWPGSRIRSLGEMAAQVEGDLQAQLQQLNQKLYSQRTADWEGRQLWKSFSTQPTPTATKAAQPQLEPLYRVDSK
jgi:hypothetical protein